MFVVLFLFPVLQIWLPSSPENQDVERAVTKSDYLIDSVGG